MGIVNLTPDSFSDGGRWTDPQRAIDHALQLVAEGAEILDFGGESTRPGAPEIPAAEELRRVLPVLEGLAGHTTAVLSIDTRKPEVAREAIAAGAEIVNDIQASRSDDGMWATLAATGAGYVAMHMQGTPATMQQAPHYTDVVAEVRDFFGDRLARLTAAGVRSERVVLDPGIGFGKTPAHNLELLRHADALTVLGRPLLYGVSRKSFLGALLGAPVDQRLPGSLAATVWAARAGAAIFRTHDVAATVQALRLTELLAGPHSPPQHA